jgi:hypothetical protein
VAAFSSDFVLGFVWQFGLGLWEAGHFKRFCGVGESRGIICFFFLF